MVDEFPDSALATGARSRPRSALRAAGRRAEAEEAFRALAERRRPGPVGRGGVHADRPAQGGRRASGSRRWRPTTRSPRPAPTERSARAPCTARGLIRYRLGLFKEALEDFERVVTRVPAERRGRAGVLHARLVPLPAGQRRRRRSRCARQFIEKYPDSAWAPDVLFWLGEYHFNHGDYAEAERQFAELAERYPEGALADDALFWAGRAAAEQKEYLRAIEHYNAPGEELSRQPEARRGAVRAGRRAERAGPVRRRHPRLRGDHQEVSRTATSSTWPGAARATASSRSARTIPSATRRRWPPTGWCWTARARAQDLKWQAEYKIGRCREKMGQPAEALEHYMNVVYAYLADAEKGAPGDPLWFTRAAFNAAAIKEVAGEVARGGEHLPARGRGRRAGGGRSAGTDPEDPISNTGCFSERRSDDVGTDSKRRADDVADPGGQRRGRRGVPEEAASICTARRSSGAIS